MHYADPFELRSRLSERDAPVPAEHPQAQTLQQWAQRAARLPDLVAAREIASLTAAQLRALEATFRARPTLPLGRALRLAAWPAGVLAVVGAGLLTAGLLASGSADRELVAAGAVGLALGLAIGSMAALIALSRVPVLRAYRFVGLLVRELDEQHAWLYAARRTLDASASAAAYRDRVSRARGDALRGVDYVLMKELQVADECADGARSAREVVQEVQGGFTPPEDARRTQPHSGAAAPSPAVVEATGPLDEPGEAAVPTEPRRSAAKDGTASAA